METEFYWEIELYSGETIRVKPENVRSVQEKIAAQTGAITTPTRSIIVKDIKDFRVTDQRFIDQKLLEGSAQAFGEPIMVPGKKISRPNPDGTPGEYQYNDAVAAKWVKKSVPRRKWDTYYSKFGSYRRLDENESYVVMAYVLPTHSIDYKDVQDVTHEEYLKLSHEPS